MDSNEIRHNITTINNRLEATMQRRTRYRVYFFGCYCQRKSSRSQPLPCKNPPIISCSPAKINLHWSGGIPSLSWPLAFELSWYRALLQIDGQPVDVIKKIYIPPRRHRPRWRIILNDVGHKNASPSGWLGRKDPPLLTRGNSLLTLDLGLDEVFSVRVFTKIYMPPQGWTPD